jgi:hypothetical protein
VSLGVVASEKAGGGEWGGVGGSGITVDVMLCVFDARVRVSPCVNCCMIGVRRVVRSSGCLG